MKLKDFLFACPIIGNISICMEDSINGYVLLSLFEEYANWADERLQEHYEEKLPKAVLEAKIECLHMDEIDRRILFEISPTAKEKLFTMDQLFDCARTMSLLFTAIKKSPMQSSYAENARTLCSIGEQMYGRQIVSAYVALKIKVMVLDSQKKTIVKEKDLTWAQNIPLPEDINASANHSMQYVFEDSPMILGMARHIRRHMP